MIVFRDAWRFLTTSSSWHGQSGLIHLGLQQLLLTVTALGIALAIGLPIALWLGHIGRFGFLAINISNVGRSVPIFGLLGLLVTFDAWSGGIPLPFTGAEVPVHIDWFPGVAVLGPYGRAGASTLLALALFALPPIITNAYVGVREVSGDVLDAACGMGMSGAQRFWKVELPLSRALVFSGVRLALVQVWATATIAALVAGPGLGNVITDGFARNRFGEGLAGAFVVSIVALVLELLAALTQALLQPAQARAMSRRATPEGSADDAEGLTMTDTELAQGART